MLIARGATADQLMAGCVHFCCICNYRLQQALLRQAEKVTVGLGCHWRQRARFVGGFDQLEINSTLAMQAEMKVGKPRFTGAPNGGGWR